MTRRDQQLGDALSRLDVPEHQEDFFLRLDHKLDAVDDEVERESAYGTARAEETSEGQADRPQARRSGPESRSAWFRRPLAWSFAAAAVAAVVLLGMMLAPRELLPDQVVDRLGPQPATAAEIKAKVQATMEKLKSLRGVLVVVSADPADQVPSEMRWEFLTTSQGDFRYWGTNTLADGSSRVDDLAFDSKTGVERSLSTEAGETWAGERVGVAPSAPDQGPSEWILQRRLGSVVRALLAAEAPGITEVVHEGREAWVLDIAVDPNRIASYSGDHLEVTVDQATGFPVRVVESVDGKLIQEIRLEQLEIDPVLPPDAFTLEFPPDADVYPADDGFRRVDLETAAQTVGYQPPVPGWVPEGFSLSVISAAEEAMSTGKEGTNPAAGDVVSIVYRRGFDQITVTTRPIGEDPTLWSDPLAGGEGFVDEPQAVDLREGALTGASAWLQIDPRTTPHLWALSDLLVVTVAGDLTRDELVAVAESLGVGD